LIGIASRLQVESEEERIAAATSAEEAGRKLRSVGGGEGGRVW
jgi:hypothetical protein